MTSTEQHADLPTHCPHCASRDFEVLRATSAGVVFDCQDCGREFGVGS